jgi:RecJ-like exonuclease
MLPVRMKGYDNFVLLLTTNWNAEIVESLEILPKILIERRDVNPTSIEEICDKIQKGKELFSRKYPRFPIDVNCTLRNFNGGKLYNGIARNLSKGGVQIEIDDPNAKLDKILQINIKLSQLNKAHDLTASVAWQRSENGKLIIGVKFEDTLEVYRKLLKVS